MGQDMSEQGWQSRLTEFQADFWKAQGATPPACGHDAFYGGADGRPAHCLICPPKSDDPLRKVPDPHHEFWPMTPIPEDG